MNIVLHLYTFHTNFVQISGSQTFPVRGPPKIFYCSAKHKILIRTDIRGPLELVWRTTSGPRSRLWETLVQIQGVSEKQIFLKKFNLWHSCSIDLLIRNLRLTSVTSLLTMTKYNDVFGQIDDNLNTFQGLKIFLFLLLRVTIQFFSEKKLFEQFSCVELRRTPRIFSHLHVRGFLSHLTF